MKIRDLKRVEFEIAEGEITVEKKGYADPKVYVTIREFGNKCDKFGNPIPNKMFEVDLNDAAKLGSVLTLMAGNKE